MLKEPEELVLIALMPYDKQSKSYILGSSIYPMFEGFTVERIYSYKEKDKITVVTKNGAQFRVPKQYYTEIWGTQANLKELHDEKG